MSLPSLMDRHLDRMACQLVDSTVETTRVFWRTKFFNATSAEAADPRPFAVVLAERAA